MGVFYVLAVLLRSWALFYSFSLLEIFIYSLQFYMNSVYSTRIWMAASFSSPPFPPFPPFYFTLLEFVYYWCLVLTENLRTFQLWTILWHAFPFHNHSILYLFNHLSFRYSFLYCQSSQSVHLTYPLQCNQFLSTISTIHCVKLLGVSLPVLLVTLIHCHPVIFAWHLPIRTLPTFHP